MTTVDLRSGSPRGARSSVPALQQLARLVTGEPQAALRRLLTLVCEQLAMDAAFVAVITPAGDREVRVAVDAAGQPLAVLEGRSDALAETWCGTVVRDGELLVEDVREHPELRALPTTAAYDIVAYAGVPLLDEDGTTVGTLCAIGHAEHASLNDRDRDVLVGLAEVVTPLLRALEAPEPPVRRSAPDLAGVAEALGGAHDVEQLSRPLLDALHELTGLASSYLTVVHGDEGLQEVRYARNAHPGFEIPEGLRVPWEDTLCKRSLDEGRPCVTDVPTVWADSQAAAALGIQVYVSVPVELSDGRVWGTLCAADSKRADDVAAHLPTMRLFARLIGAEVERELSLQRERAGAESARVEAETDVLTGCASRRVVDPWLAAALAGLTPEQALLVAYVDVDRFKVVNDERGHAAGDAVLTEVARRLRAASRPHDLVARLGGDEFVVAAVLPHHGAGPLVARLRSAMRFSLRWQDGPLEVRASVGAALSDGRSAADLLAAADLDMYADKRA